MGLQDTLFGKTTYNPIRISNELQRSVDLTSGGSLDRYRKRKGEVLDAFQVLANRTLPKVESAVDLGMKDLNAGSTMLRSYNPLATYERIRGGNLASLTSLADTLSGVGRRNESALAARLGMAGRPMSSARDLIRSSGTATAFAPIANTIYGNLGNDTTGISRDTFNQVKGLQALAAARPDLYGNLYQYALAPLVAEQQALGGETDALNALAQAVAKNYAGMDVQKKMGIMDYPLRLSENLSGTVGNLADAAGSVMGIAGGFMGGGMGGGGGGGMLGGLFGGGGGAGAGGGASSPNLNWGSWSPSMGGGGGYQPMPYGGGMGFGNWFGGGSPAVDVNSMNPIQLLMLQQAQRYGAQNVPVGSVWE